MTHETCEPNVEVRERPSFRTSRSCAEVDGSVVAKSHSSACQPPSRFLDPRTGDQYLGACCRARARDSSSDQDTDCAPPSPVPDRPIPAPQHIAATSWCLADKPAAHSRGQVLTNQNVRSSSSRIWGREKSWRELFAEVWGASGQRLAEEQSSKRPSRRRWERSVERSRRTGRTMRDKRRPVDCPEY